MASSKPLYIIIGVIIPLSVLILWSMLFPQVFWFFASARPPFTPLDEMIWCLAGFLSAVAASFYVELTKKTFLRSGAANLRGCIVVAAASYALLSLFRRDLPLAARFLPSVKNIFAALAALFSWFSVISLRQVFMGLELFQSFTAQHQGEQLREIVREYSPEMSQTDARIKNLMVSYGLQFIPPCILMSAPVFSRNSLYMSIFVFLVFCGGFLFLGFLSLERRMLSYGSQGISLRLRDRALPVPVMAAGMGIAAFLALAGSSDTSLLPPGIILGFFALLGRLLSSLFRHRNPEALDLSFFSNRFGNERMFSFDDAMEEALPWAGWKWIRYGVIAIAGLLFLFFMIYPLLKRSGFSLKPGAVRAALARWFTELRKSFSAFFAALREKQAKIQDEEKLRRIASELLRGGVKRKELKRSVNLFARLILWGIETQGVAWKPSLAPGEYCGLLAGRTAPPLAEKIILCAGLFEKALYSARPLGQDEEKDFERMVREITGA